MQKKDNQKLNGRKNKDSKKKEDKSFIFKLSSHFTVFLDLFALSMAILFISGNFQQFKDSSQIFILTMASTALLLITLFIVWDIILCFFLLISSKKLKYLLFAALYILVIALNLAFFFLFRTITFASAGL